MKDLRKEVSFENRVWVILTVVLFVVTLSGIFVYKSLSNIVNEITEEARPDESVILMKEMIYDISDAENSVKSYGLTNDATYLENFNNKNQSIQEKLLRLRLLTEMKQETKNNVDTLDTLLQKKFMILENLLIVQSEYRVNDALDKVISKIETTNNKNDNEPIVNKESEPVSDKEVEDKFFKKLINKRKNNPDKIDQKKEEIIVNTDNKVTLEEINEEITQVKYEEKLINQTSLEEELFLIQEDKLIMDQIMTIFNEMEEAETMNMDEKLALAESQSGHTKILIAVFCILACALLFLAGYAVNTYVKRNDAFKTALRRAKQETDLRNQEITDSILYAQRIQEAILPDMDKMKSYLNESFILYRPKDIVAGDFYWAIKTDDIVFLAVADCTGHGVPGAMVSVVCNNALNRSVREFGLTKPSAILEKCRDLVIETFAAGNHNVNDGMDIALVALRNTSVGGETKTVIEFSGANNSLYIVKNKILQEIISDKQPVGIYQHQSSFTNHQFTLDKNDVLYLFSDGMADQFGGPKGKKFKYKAFQELLVENSTFDMELQRRNIQFAFADWKGTLEQVDDVCIIGVRI